jgi:hypothetical protein
VIVRDHIFGHIETNDVIEQDHFGAGAEENQQRQSELERYRVKTDNDSGIVNDPNDWGLEHGDPDYILNLVKRIVTVSVETVRIVNDLPSMDVSAATMLTE